MKRFYIETWGCQMNVHDSERISCELRHEGLEPSSSVEEADLILLNTCSVREKPAEKIFAYLGRIHSLRQKNPRLRIGVCGCVAQQEKEGIFRRSPIVDFVVGPGAISRLGKIVKNLKRGRRGIVECDEYPLSTLQKKRDAEVKAYVVIMEGCDNFCSFCVVPYTRGRERSRPHQEIMDEIEVLVCSGVKEIELLGQNVNSYRDGEVRLAGLLERIDRIPSLERLRFTTSHPKDLSQEIIAAMRDLGTVCPHLHLPVQSGSNRILKSMNRKYTRQEYLETIGLLRKSVPGIALTTDIIVGFPGETDNDHGHTLSLLEEIAFDGIYSFKYSPRPNTEASRFEDDVPKDVKQKRLEEVQLLQKEIQKEKNKRLVGQTFQVLVDGQSKRNPEEYTGRTPCHRVVNFYSPTSCLGRLVEIRVVRAHPNSLYGEIIEKEDMRNREGKKALSFPT